MLGYTMPLIGSCVVGMIQSEDGRQRVLVYRTMAYLVKDEQHLRVLRGGLRRSARARSANGDRGRARL